MLEEGEGGEQAEGKREEAGGNRALPTVVGKIWILLDMARFSEKNVVFDYTAFGRVWYGAKYSHRVWEQFAHTFEK